MKIYFELVEGERFNNFTVAEAIYNACMEPANENVLNPAAISNMLQEQILADRRR